MPYPSSWLKGSPPVQQYRAAAYRGVEGTYLTVRAKGTARPNALPSLLRTTKRSKELPTDKALTNPPGPGRAVSLRRPCPPRRSPLLPRPAGVAPRLPGLRSQPGAPRAARPAALAAVQPARPHAGVRDHGPGGGLPHLRHAGAQRTGTRARSRVCVREARKACIQIARRSTTGQVSACMRPGCKACIEVTPQRGVS